MKKIFLIASLTVGLIACNNDSTQSSATNKDTSNHTAHQSGSDNHSATGQDHMKDMHDAMNNMMHQMQSMSPTGDADYDFAMMMKHHHQGAIDMAKSEIAGGTDDQLKQMAQKMIDQQQKENAEFDKVMQGKQPSGSSNYGKEAMSMMTPMSNIKMESSSLDAMFASMMIPHHQDAVKMAKEYLNVGKSEELKKIARDIILTQPKEINELQQWLNAHKS
jgi:uncharacterized protein (DUF305 family)